MGNASCRHLTAGLESGREFFWGREIMRRDDASALLLFFKLVVCKGVIPLREGSFLLARRDEERLGIRSELLLELAL